jgi:hypothetical protein
MNLTRPSTSQLTAKGTLSGRDGASRLSGCSCHRSGRLCYCLRLPPSNRLRAQRSGFELSHGCGLHQVRPKVCLLLGLSTGSNEASALGSGFFSEAGCMHARHEKIRTCHKNTCDELAECEELIRTEDIDEEENRHLVCLTEQLKSIQPVCPSVPLASPC